MRGYRRTARALTHRGGNRETPGAKKYRETASGVKADRAQLGRVVAALGPGDVLVVTSLDRLARSTRDLLNTLATITAREAESGRWPTPGRTRRRRTAVCS